MADNLGDRMFRAMRAIDPAAPMGPWQLVTTGTVVIGGGAVGGAGGTSMVDNNTFTPGGTSITPMGAYVGGRQVASGNAGAPAMSASAILQVHVVAGGAGGGVANITVHGTAGNDVNVGVASGAAGAAGNWPMPVVYASGRYQSVNMQGIATVNLGSIPTVNLGLGTVNVGNGIVGSVRTTVGGGSVGVVQITSPWVVGFGGDATVWVANPAAGGSGFASVAVYGSPAMPVYNVGTTHVSNPVGVLGLAGSVHVLGSVRIIPPQDHTVWVANPAAGGGFASVAVYGSPGMPVYNIGTVHVSNFSAGTGFASVAVYGSPAMPVYALGTVHVSNFAAGTGFASVAVYGSPAMPVYVIGSINAVGGGGSMGAVNLGGSVGVTQIGAPWSMVGSVHVSPAGPTFTVALDKIPTVNIGLGTVNVGNIVTVTLPAVQVVDTRGSLVPTQWPISLGGSGYLAISSASITGGVRTKLYLIHLSTRASVNQAVSFQSPSGTFLTGSIPVPPGGGFNIATQIHNPVLIGGSNATLFLHATGTENIGGWVAGYIEAG